MASINGVTIRGLKKFYGHDGETLYQGNVYYNGKKLGFWSQDAYSGSDSFHFDTSVIQKAVDDYRDYSGKAEGFRKTLFSTEIFMCDVLWLIREEKQYKKYAKSWYSVMISVKSQHRCVFYAYSCNEKTEKKKEEAIRAYRKEAVRKFKKEAPVREHDSISVDTYTCLADFEKRYSAENAGKEAV